MLNFRLIYAEYYPNISGVTRIYICKIRLLLKYNVLPFFLLIRGYRICLSRQTYHLFKSCIAEYLDSAVFKQLPAEILASRSVEIQRVVFIMNCTYVSYLWCTIAVYSCKCKNSHKLHFL